MYLDYYNLIEKPFSLTPDPRYFFASDSHAEARDLLRYGIHEREGFMSLVGATGTGKTTLLRTVLDEFGDEVVTALVLNPFLSEEDLLATILVDIGACTRAELASEHGRRYPKQQLVDRLNEHLMGLSGQGRAAVLVIDEAQNLPLPVLEQVRLLSNLETSKAKLLQIILAGQLGLRDLLATRQLSQLTQRISVRYMLQPLNVREIIRYIEHRLRIAGSAGDIVFTEAAVQRLNRHSQRVPRLLNLLCDRALLAGYAQRSKEIGPKLIDQAARMLDLGVTGVALPIEHCSSDQRPPRLMSRLAAGAVAATAVLTAAHYLLSSPVGLRPEILTAHAEGVQNVTVGPSFADDSWELAAPTPSESAQLGVSKKAAKLPATSGPTDVYTVYISSFRRAEDPNLVRLRTQLSKNGYQHFLVRAEVPGQGTLHRLVVGDFNRVEDAKGLSYRLRRRIDVAHAEVVEVAEVRGARR